MSKAGDIAKVSLKGSFHVLWGIVLSTIIGSVGTIFIARLLGSDLYGLYTVVLTVPAILQVFRDWGVNSAMVRFTAQYRAEGRTSEIRSIFLSGIIFEVIVGLSLTAFSFFFADFLAATVFNRPFIAPLIKIISISIFASALISAATSVFTGYERLELNSVMLVVQSIFKTSIIIGLVLSGLGPDGATIGFTLGTLIAGIVGVALISLIYRQLPKPSTYKLELKAYFSTMLTYCLPLSIATIITALLPQFYAFLLPIYYPINNVPIGNYGVAMNFSILTAFFILPIATTMFPAFSKLDPHKDKAALAHIFRFSIKYGSLFVVPITVLVMSLANPAVATLFGDTYDTAALFLTLLSIPYLFTALGNISIPALLYGLGQTKFVLRIAVVTGLICFPLGYFSIMTLGVLGLIITTIVMSLPTIVMGLAFIKKTYGLTVDFISSGRVVLASGLTGTLTYFVVSELVFSAWLRLLLGVVLFVMVVVPALLLSRAVTRSDVVNLKVMAGGLGALGGLVNKALVVIERLMTFLKL